MADDRAFAEQTKRIQPSNRRCAMPARDFVKFHHGLRSMHLPGKPALIGLSPAILQKPGRAGINLRRHHHAKKPAAFMLFSALHQAQRFFHRLFAGFFIPFIFNHMAILGEPAGRTEHGRHTNPHAGFCQQIKPAWMRHGKIRKRRHTGKQQFGKCHAHAMRHRFRIRAEDRHVFVKR